MTSITKFVVFSVVVFLMFFIQCVITSSDENGCGRETSLFETCALKQHLLRETIGINRSTRMIVKITQCTREKREFALEASFHPSQNNCCSKAPVSNKVDRSELEDFCQCPSIVPKINFSDAENVRRAQIFMVKSMWSKIKLSEKGDELKKIMIDFIKSDNLSWKEISLTCTVWIFANIFKDESERNLCKFAQLINATLPWQTKHDCSLMSKAIDDLIASIQYSAESVYSVGLKHSECGSGELRPNPPKCYANGTVYDIDELWDLNGNEVPDKLREITKSLYKSNNYFDELLAVVTTAGLSLPLRLAVMYYEPNLLYGMMYGSVSPKLPECCCSNYKNFMKTYLEICETSAGPFSVVVKETAACI